MTETEAIRKLEQLLIEYGISGNDADTHMEADEIILNFAPEKVKEIYRQLEKHFYYE